jgi:hypothetical protein
VALLAALPARAGPSLEGTGRVTAEVGWRLTPNDSFYADALKVGLTRTRDSVGGPTVMGSFGYMMTDQLELSIDLFAGGERLALQGLAPINSVTYGATVGPRLYLPLGPFAFAEDWRLFAGVLVGPTLVLAFGGNIPGTSEVAIGSYMGSVGVAARLSDELGLSLEYRLLLVRGQVPGIGGVNGGGSWLGIGLTWHLAGEPMQSHSLP